MDPEESTITTTPWPCSTGLLKASCAAASLLGLWIAWLSTDSEDCIVVYISWTVFCLALFSHVLYRIMLITMRPSSEFCVVLCSSSFCVAPWSWRSFFYFTVSLHTYIWFTFLCRFQNGFPILLIIGLHLVAWPLYYCSQSFLWMVIQMHNSCATVQLLNGFHFDINSSLVFMLVYHF